MPQNFTPTLFFLLTLFLSTTSVQSQEDRQEKMVRLLDSAATLMDANRILDAINLSKDALSIYGERKTDTLTINAHNTIVRGFLKESKLDSCLFYLNKVLQNPETKKYESSRSHLSTYFLAGNVYRLIGKHSDAINFREKALNIAISTYGEKHRNTIKAHNQLGETLFLSRNYSLASTHFNTALANRLEMTGHVDNDKLIMNSLNMVAQIYSVTRDFEKALEYSNRALKVSKQINANNPLELVLSQVRVAGIYLDKGDYHKALEHYEPSLDTLIGLLKNGAAKERLAVTYFNMAVAYMRVTGPNKAIDFFTKSNNLRIKLYGEQYYGIAPGYAGIGASYIDMGVYDKAIEYLQKANDILKVSFPEDHPQFMAVYAYLGIALRGIKQYKEAIVYQEKALNIQLKTFGENPGTVQYYVGLSETYRMCKKYDKALEYCKKGERITLNSHEKGNPLIQSLRKEFCSNYASIKDTSLLIKNLNLLSEELGYNDRVAPDYFEQINNFLDLEDYFDLKTTYYELMLEKTKNRKFVDSIKINNQNSIVHQDFWLQKNPFSEAATYRIGRTISVYEKSIEHLIKNGNPKELAQAFKLSEKTKSRQLAKAFKETNVKHLGKELDSITQQQNEIEKELADFEKKVFEIKSKKDISNDSLFITLESKVFDLKLKRGLLQEMLKKKYPKYHNLIYNHEVVSVNDIQKMLRDNQALVEYFVGNEAVYIYVISKNSFKVKKIDKDFPLNDWITKFRNSIYRYYELPKEYATWSYLLFEKLLKPIEEELKEELIIIPDGILNYIPFEALIMSEASETANYKTLPYVINKHQISYNYSATLYQQLLGLEPSDSKKNFLGFAPNFKNIEEERSDSLETLRNDLGNLKYNVPEIQKIRDLIGGRIFTGNDATEENFQGYAENYKIIHLATHSKSNDALGDYSFIAFSGVNDSIPDDYRLYTRELYNLSLNSDMIVLSACETGLGELKKGEGVIGLARGLTYAGARSTITSLWNVRDKQTMILMDLFYKNIKLGMSKDKALREAKLSYLQNEVEVPPYFWAGFVAVGNMDSIKLSNDFEVWWIIGGVFLLVLVLFLVAKRKNIRLSSLK